MSQPLTQADIIFPHLSNTPNLSSTLSSLRRSTLSIHNRLSSIISDGEFITSVSSAYSLPLIANERCGSWYIPPDQKSGSVYFKSTDGHMGEWGFSLRRLNLQLLNFVEKWGGAIVVDSTRRGKSMPDALSKTVPIWCCVINRAVFGETKKELGLFTPPQAVSESEHAQIERRVDGFVRQFLEICKPNIPNLRAKLQKPLRPIWVTQQSSLPDSPPSFPDFHPIILCTASRRVRGAELSESGYIQGAADDHEAWSHGLTPPLFWKHKDLLMSTSEEDAPSVISNLVKNETESKATTTLIQPTTKLHISSSENVDLTGFNVVISCTPTLFQPSTLKAAGVQRYLHLKCQSGKLGSRDLRTHLPQILPFFSSLLSNPSGKILVCCPTGKDLSVGTALAILCLYTDDNGVLDTHTRRGKLDKSSIKQRLSWITTSNPALNPSRSTLQSVNAVLLGGGWDPKDVTTSSQLPQTPPQPDSTPQNPVPQDSPRPCHKALFNSLTTQPNQTWKYTRTLTSALPSHPSGTVVGSASFTPPPSSAQPNSNTLFYAETGEFTTDTGMKFTTRREYIYALDSSTEDEEEHIAIYFAPEGQEKEQGNQKGGLFLRLSPLTLSSPEHSTTEEKIWQSTSKETHLCGPDAYTATWRFSDSMLNEGKEGEKWWEVEYDVKGVGKDYSSKTLYTMSASS